MKKIILLLPLLSVVITVSAQFEKGFLTSDQYLLYRAAEKSLYIVRQDYILKETKKVNPGYFGRGGNPYFSRRYALAVLFDKKLWCSSEIRTPWLSDPDFEDYRNNDTLQPVLAKVSLRPVSKQKFEYLDLKLCDQKIQDSLFAKTGLTFYDLLLSENEIHMENQTSNKDGWLIMVYTQNNIADNDTTNLLWAIYQPKPEFTAGDQCGKIKDPPFTNNIIGGIYFTAFIQTANISLNSAGIINRQLLSYCISKFPSYQKATSSESVNPGGTSSDKIIPIKDKPSVVKKNVKDETEDKKRSKKSENKTK